jgi:tripartite-type tricarboxylate transporter receptor subunit TctC
MKRHCWQLVFGIAALSLAPLGVAAADFPSKPIRMIVTFPPGASSDSMARALEPKLRTNLGQPVVVENRPGAGGNIGMDVVAKAAPDGYTVGVGAAGALAVNPSLMASMPFQPLKDLAPITMFAEIPFVFVANPASGIGSMGELIKRAKSDSKSVSIGHGGNGTAMHLSAALLTHNIGAKLALVPYKGSAPVVTDVLAGHVPVGVSDLPGSLGQIKAGKLKALAVTSKRRVRFLPDVPTVAESGIAGYESVGWFGIVAPAGTPPEIIKRLNQAFVSAMKDPEVVERIGTLGADVSPSTPEAFGAFIRSETGKWSDLIKAAGIRTE